MIIIDKYYYLAFSLLKKYDKRTFPEFGAAVVVFKSVFIGFFVTISFLCYSELSLITIVLTSLFGSIVVIYLLLFRKNRYKQIQYSPRVHWWIFLVLFEVIILSGYILTMQEIL
jgi:hypothetical protein